MNLQPRLLKMYGFLLWMALFTFCISTSSYAQAGKEIHGTITNMANKPLSGVSVGVKGTKNIVLSDDAGQYHINAKVGATLEFSYIGLAKQEIIVGAKSQIDIALAPDANSLNDVVVVGYGTQKKIDLTGSIATVKGDELEKRHVVDPASSMEGLLPGVSVVQNSGQPGGEGTSIQIRGQGTYSGAGSNPLVLIDGVEGDLSTLDPATIESVSVLKDAASASIYGSRGANGVILVTTKDGSENKGKFKVNYNINYSLANPTTLPDLVTNSVQYMQLFNEGKLNGGITDPNQLYPDSIIALYQNPSDPIKYPNANWASIMFKTAPTLINTLSISGGEKTTYNATISYANQKGDMQAFSYKKFNARFNLASRISKIFRVGFNIGLNNGNQSQPMNGAADAFYQTIAHPPTALPFLPDGSGRYTYQAYPWESTRSNQFAANNQLAENVSYTITSQAWADLEIIDRLHWFTKVAVNGTFNRNKSFAAEVPVYNYFNPDNLGFSSSIPGTGLNESMDQTIYKNLYSYLTYNHAFGKHEISVQGGYSMEQDNYYFLQASRPSYSVGSLQELNAGDATPQYNSGTSNAWALESFFGRANYNYQNKYLFEANVRYDGSSRLSPDSRWGIFPSFSAGWRITEEKFMENIKKSWLTDLKIRGSWGQLGNQNIGLYPYQSLINIGTNYPFGSNLQTGAEQSALNNPSISWETTTMSDIGFDATLFKHLNVTFDAYKKLTTNILRSAQITGIVGLSAPTINSGAMSDVGLELAVKYSNTVQYGALEGLTYNAGFNISGFRNKVVDFGTPQDNGSSIIEQGKPWNSFYILQLDGIFQDQAEIDASPKQFGETTAPGDLKFKDINKDGVIDNNDRVLMTKGVFPAYNFGINLSASFKGFDIYAFVQSVQGQKGIFGGGGIVPFWAAIPPTKQIAEQSWTPENHSNTMPKLYYYTTSGSARIYNHPSTFLLYDMSYIRVKNLQIGYTLPKSVAKKIAMSNLRLYVSGDNLFTFTKFPGMDPETPQGAYLTYPQNKVISFGLSATF